MFILLTVLVGVGRQRYVQVLYYCFNRYRVVRFKCVFLNFHIVRARAGHSGAAGDRGVLLYSELLQCSSLSQSPESSGRVGGHTTGRWIGKHQE